MRASLVRRAARDGYHLGTAIHVASLTTPRPDATQEILVPPQNLRIPGPTPLPDAVREAGSRQMVNHRGPEFKELVGRVSEGMRPAFRTTQRRHDPDLVGHRRTRGGRRQLPLAR